MAKDATERAIGTAESIKSNGGAKKRRRFATTDTLEQEHSNTVFLKNHFIDIDDMNSIVAVFIALTYILPKKRTAL